MNRLANALEGTEKGWDGAKYVRIDGGTDHEDRRLAVNQFRDDPSVAVALLSVTAAGEPHPFRAFHFSATCMCDGRQWRLCDVRRKS